MIVGQGQASKAVTDLRGDQLEVAARHSLAFFDFDTIDKLFGRFSPARQRTNHRFNGTVLTLPSNTPYLGRVVGRWHGRRGQQWKQQRRK